MFYYKHHIGDFRSGTANMSRQERWIYRDMLDLYYDKEKPLPADIQDLCDSIGATEDEQRSIAKILRLKFNQTETGWVHERCEIELENYRGNADIARQNGKKGGRPRKITQPVPSGMPSATQQEPSGNPEESESQANHKPLTTNQEPVTSKVKSIVPASAETLQVFTYWQQVMNHPQAKLDAKRERAIKARLKDGYSVGDLCRAVDGCSRSPHHMGQNETRTVYDDIELICRDGPKVDGFIKKAASASGPQRSNNQQQTLNNLQAYLEGTK